MRRIRLVAQYVCRIEYDRVLCPVELHCTIRVLPDLEEVSQCVCCIRGRFNMYYSGTVMRMHWFRARRSQADIGRYRHTLVVYEDLEVGMYVYHQRGRAGAWKRELPELSGLLRIQTIVRKESESDDKNKCHTGYGYPPYSSPSGFCNPGARVLCGLVLPEAFHRIELSSADLAGIAFRGLRLLPATGLIRLEDTYAIENTASPSATDTWSLTTTNRTKYTVKRLDLLFEKSW